MRSSTNRLWILGGKGQVWVGSQGQVESHLSSVAQNRAIIVRFGIAAIVLSLAFYYMRSVHSIDPAWAQMAFWGAFLSVILALTQAVARWMR